MSTIIDIIDLTPNDSNKDFTWTQEVRLLWLLIDLRTTATVGSRRIVVELIGPDGEVRCWIPIGEDVSPGIAASKRCTHRLTPGIFRDFANPVFVTPDTDMSSVVPEGFYIVPGYTLRIRDFNGIDVAADDMDVTGQVEADTAAPVAREAKLL